MSPSPSQVAALIVATATIADIVEHPGPLDRRALACLAIDRAADHAAACDVRKLDRRLGVHAASWANTYLVRFADRSNVTVLRLADLDALPRTVTTAQRALLSDAPGAADGIHPLDVRLIRHTAAGVGIDQLTHAHTAAAVGVDDFARRAVTAHLALVTELEAFTGVRLLAPRVPLASRHYGPDGGSHVLGGCDDCSTATARVEAWPVAGVAR